MATIYAWYGDLIWGKVIGKEREGKGRGGEGRGWNQGNGAL
jgi:hypothetical protein